MSFLPSPLKSAVTAVWPLEPTGPAIPLVAKVPSPLPVKVKMPESAAFAFVTAIRSSLPSPFTSSMVTPITGPRYCLPLAGQPRVFAPR